MALALPAEHVRAFSKGPRAPRDCGRRLLSVLVDQRATVSPSKPVFAIHDAAQGGFVDITYAAFANAINRATRWILTEVGRSTSFGTIVYLGPSDLRYQILILAAAKTGHVLFVPSPRNHTEALCSLLDECKAKIFLHAAPPMKIVSDVMSSRPALSFLQVPELEELLDKEPVKPVPFTKPWKECRFEPFVQIHTSGSTGTPKLITLKHGNFSAVDAMQAIGGNEFGARLGEARFCCTFPPFHVAGIVYGLAIPILVDGTSILAPAVPLTAEIVDSMHVDAGAEYSLLPPSIVIDLAKNPVWLRNLDKLKGISYSGGPLPEAIGSLVVQHTSLAAGWGTSEYQAAPQLRKEKEDWAYFRFNELEGGIEFQEREGGLYEMVHVRKPLLDLVQPVFVTFPQLNVYYTKDLFSKHPTKPGMYRYVSRSDDIIVFSNGEKLNPTTMEGMITTAPGVKGCLVIGQGKFQACLLIEPVNDKVPKDQLLERVWPYIKSANKSTVKHGRIAKQLVFFTEPGKPLLRAGKGTIQRAANNKRYADEVNQLYASLESGSLRAAARGATETAVEIDLSTVKTAEATLTSFLVEEANLQVSDVSDDFFFAQGMDSLQVSDLTNAINSSRKDNPIEKKQVYDHPSIRQLARYLVSDVVEVSMTGYDSDDEEIQAAWLLMEETLNEYEQQIDEQTGRKNKERFTLRSSDQGPVVQPDGGTVAWLQILASFLININNWGLVNAFGVFQTYYETNLLNNHSVFAISWIGTIQGALVLIVGAFSGPLFDTGYFKPLVTAASIGLVLALVLLSRCSQYYQVLLCQGLLLGICSGMLYVPSVVLVPVYFKHRRGLALGLATAGGSLGGVIYPLIFQHLLHRISFAWAVRTIALLALLTLGTATLILRPLGPRIRRQIIDTSAFTERNYTLFCITSLIVFAAALVPFFLAPTYSIQRLHSTNTTYTVPLLNFGQFFGRILPALMSDHNAQIFGPEALLLAAQITAGILGFAWLGVTNMSGFVPWLLIYGFLAGMLTTLPAIVLPYLCSNMATYGTRLGMLYAFGGVGLLVSTPVAAALNEAVGGFHGAMVWVGCASLVGAAVFVRVGWEARRRRLSFEMGDRRGKARRVRRVRRGRAF